jgi:hypothetical protein
MLNRFTIFGERCSGTNFLEESILLNFDTQVTWDYGWKHFFGFTCLENSDDTLFICIVRNGFTWINSLLSKPYHLDKAMLKTNETFLTHAITSYHKGSMLREDLNMYTHEPYRNIYELRRVKIDFMMKRLPLLVKNLIFVRYEDLCVDFQSQMARMAIYLTPKVSSYIQPDWYMKNRNRKFTQREHRRITRKEFYDRPEFGLIQEQERELGYLDGGDRA